MSAIPGLLAEEQAVRRLCEEEDQVSEKRDIRYSWKDWDWGEWTENVEKMPPELRKHIRGVIDQCDALPLRLSRVEQANNTQNILTELSIEQIDACDNPQIIQRVKGARYIIDLDGENVMPSMLHGMNQSLEDWWATDEPFLLVRRPFHICVIMLPEAAE